MENTNSITPEHNYLCFTGGPVETNSYLIQLSEGNLLIDAPQGAASYFKDCRIHLLVLTHGHFDHVMDAAAIARSHQCPVLMHQITEEIIADTGLLQRYGLNIQIEPIKASQYLSESNNHLLLGYSFSIFEVPGHCPGSLCFYDRRAGFLYGGDVLFAGGVGRWDLPGGNRELLLEGIQKKLFTLPAPTRVLPGHGLETTIGKEKDSNPYF